MKTLQEIALKGCGEFVSKFVQNWDMQDLMEAYIKSFQEGKISYSKFVKHFQLLKDEDKKQQDDFIKYLHFKQMVNIPSHWCTWCHQIALNFHVEANIWKSFVNQLDDLSPRQKREMILMNKMKVSHPVNFDFENIFILMSSKSVFAIASIDTFFVCNYILHFLVFFQVVSDPSMKKFYRLQTFTNFRNWAHIRMNNVYRLRLKRNTVKMFWE